MTDLAGSVTAEGKAKKNKAKKKAKKRCKRQGDQCTDLLTERCGGDPGCLEQQACCEHAGNCDIAEFLDCVIFPG